MPRTKDVKVTACAGYIETCSADISRTIKLEGVGTAGQKDSISFQRVQTEDVKRIVKEKDGDKEVTFEVFKGSAAEAVEAMLKVAGGTMSNVVIYFNAGVENDVRQSMSQKLIQSASKAMHSLKKLIASYKEFNPGLSAKELGALALSMPSVRERLLSDGVNLYSDAEAKEAEAAGNVESVA